MKIFACILLLAAVVVAEPPRYRLAKFRSERQEFGEGGEKEATTSNSAEAPYPAVGFKPSREFRLPSRQEIAPPATSYGTPDDSYGAPLRTYAAPAVEYGVPENEGEERSGKPKNEENENTEEGEVEGSGEGKEKKEKLEEELKLENDADVQSIRGAYYVLLPGSQLQRVQFQTENDVRNMAYTARLQYKSEDRAPLYVYSAVPQYQSAAYIQLI